MLNYNHVHAIQNWLFFRTPSQNRPCFGSHNSFTDSCSSNILAMLDQSDIPLITTPNSQICCKQNSEFPHKLNFTLWCVLSLVVNRELNLAFKNILTNLHSLQSLVYPIFAEATWLLEAKEQSQKILHKAIDCVLHHSNLAPRNNLGVLLPSFFHFVKITKQLHNVVPYFLKIWNMTHVLAFSATSSQISERKHLT